MVKKLARWFNERILGVVYYEMTVGNHTHWELRDFNYSGKVITRMHKHFEFGQTEMDVEAKIKRAINTFEGTPINKIKFIKKYV